MLENPLKTSHESDDAKSARGVELCVNCPRLEAYVPVIGNCVESHVAEDNRRTKGFSVKLHAQPPDPWYELEKLCQYVKFSLSKPICGDLTGISCSYEAE